MVCQLKIVTFAVFSFVLVQSAIGQSKPIFAKALRPGDTIQFVAPAGPLKREQMELAKRRLEKMGFKVRELDGLYAKDAYLAGSDQRRAIEFNAAIHDPEVDAIFPGRGGYGSMRILNEIDYDALRKNPKMIIGFSDITALHLAINKKTGLVTFHSPFPGWGLGSENNLTPLTAHWFWQAVLADRYDSTQTGYAITPYGWQSNAGRQELKTTCQLAPPITISGGKARGRLTGGNLTLVASLMGTPYEIETDGKILFLEDIGEAPYRIDRMLCTMKLAGQLDNLAGVLLGQFTRRKSEDTSDEIRTIDEVLDEYFAKLGIPVVRNFPMGHHECNATLPVGVMCELDADAQSIRLLENPVRLD